MTPSERWPLESVKVIESFCLFVMMCERQPDTRSSSNCSIASTPPESAMHEKWLMQLQVIHTRHNLPPSEIDLGLFWADSTDSEGKHLFHRIG